MGARNIPYLLVYLTESEQGSNETLSYLAKFSWTAEERNLSPFLDVTYLLQFLIFGLYFSASSTFMRAEGTNGCLVTDLFDPMFCSVGITLSLPFSLCEDLS